MVADNNKVTRTPGAVERDSDPARLGQFGRMKFLARDATVYGMAFALNKLLTLITFPLLARYFSVSEYGTIDLLNAAIVILTILAVFGHDSSGGRFFFDDKGRDRRQQVVSQSLALQMVLAFLIATACWIYAAELASLAGGEGVSSHLVRLMGLQVPFFVLVNFSQNLLKWNFQRSRFILITVGSTLATAVGLILGIFVFKFSIEGVFVVYLVVRGFFGVLGLFLVREWVVVPSGLGCLKAVTPYAIPFGLQGLMISGMPFLERSLIQENVGTHELGLYAAGAKIALLIGLPVTAFQMAWGPFSMSIIRAQGAEETYRVALKVVSIGLMILVLGLSVIGEYAVVLLGSEKYAGAGVVVFALAMGWAFQAITHVSAVGAVVAKRSAIKLPGNLLMIGTALVLIPALTSRYGINGAAAGSMIAYFVRTLSDSILAQLVYPIKFDFKGVAVLLLAVFGVGLLHVRWYSGTTIHGVALVPLISMPFIAALGWSLVLDSGERRKLISLVATKLK